MADKTTSDETKKEEVKSEEPKNESLSQEQWEVAFKHPRFKELTEAKQQLDSLKETQAKAQEQTLLEQKKFEELAETRAKEIEELKSKVQQQAINQAIITEATKNGVEDVDAVTKLIDMNQINYTDSGVEGIQEAFKSLIESKPYLVQSKTENVGGGQPNTATGDGPKIWKKSDLEEKLRDHEWYVKNKEEVVSAYREGRVVE